jgi:hypothetical protein
MNVPVGTPIKIEIDAQEFLAVIAGIERGGHILAMDSRVPQDVLSAYKASCGAMRHFFDQILIEKYPPSFKA